MSARIYVEGGSEGITNTKCRKAFRLFLEKIAAPGSFKVIASGGRRTAFENFCTALVQYPNDNIILLVDAEEAVTKSPWEHLGIRAGDGWQRPANAKDDQAQLMTQVMESWFLCDPDAIEAYYGQHFRRASLPRNQNVEQVSKRDVFLALENATKNTQKGVYHKTRHGFDLLERISPERVREVSPHAERLFASLQSNQ